jgi:hypothetical protein
VFAGGTAAVLIAGALAASGPAQAEPTSNAGVQRICVNGTHGKYARLTLLSAGHHVLTVFRLREGCVAFRVGDKLPAGTYRIKHRAPQGRLTGRVSVSGGWESPDGTAGSAISRDKRPPHLKKVKSATFEMGPTLFGVISFDSVKNRNH